MKFLYELKMPQSLVNIQFIFNNEFQRVCWRKSDWKWASELNLILTKSLFLGTCIGECASNEFRYNVAAWMEK